MADQDAAEHLAGHEQVAQIAAGEASSGARGGAPRRIGPPARQAVAGLVDGARVEFHDADVRVVLMLLAKQAGANIVLPADITGKVSLSLRDVPWREAFEAVARTAGYVVVYEES